jgi:hypothetical protein
LSVVVDANVLVVLVLDERRALGCGSPPPPATRGRRGASWPRVGAVVPAQQIGFLARPRLDRGEDAFDATHREQIAKARFWLGLDEGLGLNRSYGAGKPSCALPCVLPHAALVPKTNSVLEVITPLLAAPSSAGG